MKHWRLLVPTKYLCAADLRGKDVAVTISGAALEKMTEVRGNKRREMRKGVLSFEGADKSLVLNRTNAETIVALHGVDTEQWIGKQITLYPTTCEAFGETVECIRVRGRPSKRTRE